MGVARSRDGKRIDDARSKEYTSVAGRVRNVKPVVEKPVQKQIIPPVKEPIPEAKKPAKIIPILKNVGRGIVTGAKNIDAGISRGLNSAFLGLPDRAEDLGAYTGRKIAGFFGIKGEDELKASEAKRLADREEQKQSIGGKVGNVLGYFAPGAASSKIASKLPLLSRLAPKAGQTAIKKIGSKAVQIGVQEGIAGTGMALTESLIKGDSLADTGKRVRDYGLYGGIGGGVFGGLGQSLAPLKQARQLKKIDKAYESYTDGIFKGDVPSTSKAIPKKLPRHPLAQSMSQVDSVVPTTSNPQIDAPTSTFTPKTSTVNFANIKFVNDLPIDKAGLEDYIKQASDAQFKGIEVNLRLFAEAQERLKKFKTNIPEMTGMEGRIVSGQQQNKLSLKENAKQKWNNFYTKYVDPNYELGKFSKIAEDNSFIKATNSKKVGSTVDFIANEGLVNRSGNTIGESLKNIATDIPSDKEEAFWWYMGHRHNISRYAEGAPVFPDWNIEQSKGEIQRLVSENPQFKELSGRIDKFLRSFSDEWLGETGLVGREVLDDLYTKYPNYIPTQRDFSQLEKGMQGFGSGSGYINSPSPLKSVTGSDRNIINPMENILNLVNRTVRIARKNEVGQGILQAIRKDPDKFKNFAEILPDNYLGKKDLDNIVSIIEGGQKKYLKVNDSNFLESINGLANTQIDAWKPAKVVNNVFKSLITQKNPVFAIRNTMRDVPTSYIYGSEGNPIKFLKDLGDAFKDVSKNSDVYKQYKAIGGGGSSFFAPTDSTKYKELLSGKAKLKDRLLLPAKKVLDSIETLNALTETAPRLAEFKRTLAKTGDIQKALFDAGEITVNFARGGRATKALDVYVPYTNAGVQGLDKFFREAIDNPKKIAIKGFAAMTIPTIAQEFMNRAIDPDGYDRLDNRTRDNYFVVPMGDEQFIKIPKSRELGVLFSSLFQRIYRQSIGEDEAFKGFGNTVSTNFSPANPIENNLASPIINLRANKDFANRAIVPIGMILDNRPAYLQFDEKTSELAIALGEAANLSPKEIDYIIRAYTGVIGQLGLPAITKGNKTSNVLKSQFVTDLAYSNKASSDYYDNLDKLRSDRKEADLKDNTEKFDMLGKYSTSFNNINTSISKLNKQVKKEDDEKKKRVIKLEIEGYMRKANSYYKGMELDKLKGLQRELKSKTRKLK